jgi:hypothetical protein
MDKKFEDILKTERYKKITNHGYITNGPKKYAIHYNVYLNIYRGIFDQLLKKNIINNNARILDFGCGPAFSVYVGTKEFNLDMRGIDIGKGYGLRPPGNECQDFIYPDIHNILDIESKIDFYNGKQISIYDDNQYDLILCMWSLLFDYSNEEVTKSKTNGIVNDTNTENNKQIVVNKFKNLLRISKPNAVWVVSPAKFWTTDIANLFSIYNDKNICVKLYK